jgi:hypothetical protein
VAPPETVVRRAERQKRDPLDRYYTDFRLARACVQWACERGGAVHVLLEPCAGGGAFGRAAQLDGYANLVLGCDIDPAARPGYPCTTQPVEQWAPRVVPPGKRTNYDFYIGIITNPHYQDIHATVKQMRDLQTRVDANWLALLLGEHTLSALLASDDPPHRIAVSRIRPQWGGPGGAMYDRGDNRNSMLCLWDWGSMRDDRTTIELLPQWRAPGKDAKYVSGEDESGSRDEQAA